MDIREQKQRLRNAIEERLAHITAKERATESRSLCKRVGDLISRGRSGLLIAAFVPLPTEPDITPLLQELLTQGKALHLPMFEGGALCFRNVEDLHALVPGPLQIPEPPKESPLLDPALLDIALVPGRAFDRQGWRLGRGNGGYDRWIRKQRTANPRTQFIGVCLECQLVEAVPHEEHDEQVDAVVTARGITRIKN